MTELWEALTSDFPRTALTLMGAFGWLAILYSLLRWFVKTARDLRASFRRVSAPEDEPEAPPETLSGALNNLSTARQQLIRSVLLALGLRRLGIRLEVRWNEQRLARGLCAMREAMGFSQSLAATPRVQGAMFDAGRESGLTPREAAAAFAEITGIIVGSQEGRPETPHERIGRVFAETVRVLRDHPPRATGAEEDSSIGAPDPGMRILVSTEEPDSDNIEGLDVHVHLTGNTASLYRANTEDEGDETVWYPPEPVSGGQTTILAAEGFLLFLWAANIGEASLTDLARRRMEAKEGRLVLEGLPKNIQGALRRMPETARAETMRVFNIVQDGFPRAHAALRPTPRGRIIDLDD